MLVIENITYRIAGREILSGASAQLPTGRRVGLVGRNGAGKTTLLKLILGELHADGGEISLPSGARMGSVAQESAFEAGSACSTLCWRPIRSGQHFWTKPTMRPIRTASGTFTPDLPPSMPMPHRRGLPPSWRGWGFRPKTSFVRVRSFRVGGGCA